MRSADFGTLKPGITVSLAVRRVSSDGFPRKRVEFQRKSLHHTETGVVGRQFGTGIVEVMNDNSTATTIGWTINHGSRL